MGFTNSAYDDFFSKNISALTENNIPDLDTLENEKLVQTFFLLTIFHVVDIVKDKKAIVFYYLRRIQLIITEYREAKASLDDFILSKDNRILPYLIALSKLELVISYLDQVIGLDRKVIGHKLFEKVDNNTLERMKKCYNRIKELEKSTDPGAFVQSNYLTNTEFCTHDASMKYSEIKDVIVETAKLGNKLAAGIKTE